MVTPSAFGPPKVAVKKPEKIITELSIGNFAGRNVVECLPALQRELRMKIIEQMGLSALWIPMLSRAHRDMFREEDLALKKLAVRNLVYAERLFNSNIKAGFERNTIPSFGYLRRIAVLWAKVYPKKALDLASRLDRTVNQPFARFCIARDLLRTYPPEPQAILLDVMKGCLNTNHLKLMYVQILAPFDLNKANLFHQSIIDAERPKQLGNVSQIIAEPLAAIASVDEGLALSRLDEIPNPYIKMKASAEVAKCIVDKSPERAARLLDQATRIFNEFSEKFNAQALAETAKLLLELAMGVAKTDMAAAMMCYTTVLQELKRRLNDQGETLVVKDALIEALAFFNAEDALWAISLFPDPDERELAHLCLHKNTLAKDFDGFLRFAKDIRNTEKKMEILLSIVSGLSPREHEKGFAIAKMAFDTLKALPGLLPTSKPDFEFRLIMQLIKWTPQKEEYVLMVIENFFKSPSSLGHRIQILYALAGIFRDRDIKRAHHFISEAQKYAENNLSASIMIAELLVHENY